MGEKKLSFQNIVKSVRRENVDILRTKTIWRLILRLQQPGSESLGEALRIFRRKSGKSKRGPNGWLVILGRENEFPTILRKNSSVEHTFAFFQFRANDKSELEGSGRRV